MTEMQGEGLTFPCEYPVKVMGANEPEFFTAVCDAVRPHVPGMSSQAVKVKTSRNGRFQSLTILVYAQSREHLIDIYQSVRKLDGVMFTL